MVHKLFVYGTLHPSAAPPEVRDDVRRFRLEGKGTIRGKRLDFGEYPGVVLERGAGEVSGHIFSIPSDPKLLERLDHYEEYFADDPKSSIFLRKLVNVRREDGTTERCWAYVLNPSCLERLPSAS
ncbi:gamma-glutamylcyclotransferase family protein [Edaphobacter sp.]|uniref:gamma-glutamylcyclotransferase family protein n=1 Tax=Edaphobacter sp. TaxID=1934404 RepID=UPI002DB55B8B|nr:gamma-glutamylcyclotransferase family protein [Edaphobacter sp.]HEU5341732.1 gamma-glutamylcyclotransferase family protein [Edaphobacter sp.]